LNTMSENTELTKGHFRKGFMWGAATASYQIEGAWNEDGKGQSIWDTFVHTGHIEDGTNGDITCDSYHKYQEDINMLKNLKATHYRFSLSWSRLLPTADSSTPNPAGVDFYNKFIDALLASNIKPCVTIYHWDLPQCLQDIGGWQSDDIVEKFREYSDFCFSQFGDRVKLWITINEPHVQCGFGYGNGIHAPGIKDPLNACYQVSRTMLLAHAHAYRVYDTKYRKTQNGQISITLNSDWCEPKDPTNPEHVKAAQFYIDVTLGWFANPVYGDGDFPASMKKSQGLEKSRLPTLTEEEKKLIKGTYDFFGLNHYTTRLAEPVSEATQDYLMHPDLAVYVHPDSSWERAGLIKNEVPEWLYIVPNGLRKLLNYISKTYGDPSIIITENGCSTKNPVNDPGDTKQLVDEQRCCYITSYLNEALKAHLLDGVDLRGYFLWTLMDNFEWAAGHTERFGLHHVDFSDGNQTRTPRKSAAIYTKIIEENGFSAS
uniref:Beta-glucosidase n=1 Tax=Ciona intestinalis TaxID=7719 RepID=F6TAR1_CIOIN